jgi:Zn-dependent protease
MTLVAPVSSGAVRSRMALTTLAGPLSNLALAALASLAHPEVLDFARYTQGFAPLEAWVFANLLLGLGSLIPLKQTTEVGPAPSDGLRLNPLLPRRLRCLVQ